MDKLTYKYYYKPEPVNIESIKDKLIEIGIDENIITDNGTLNIDIYLTDGQLLNTDDEITVRIDCYTQNIVHECRYCTYLDAFNIKNIEKSTFENFLYKQTKHYVSCLGRKAYSIIAKSFGGAWAELFRILSKMGIFDR